LRNTKCLFAVSAIIAGLLTGVNAVFAQTLGNPQIVPPDAVEFGNTYGEWSARWWQWLLSIPRGSNPNYDNDPVSHCTVAQTGQVWFLAGGFFDSPSSPTRSCTIPAGKDLLLSPKNTLFGNIGTKTFSDCPKGANDPDIKCDPTVLRESARQDVGDPTLEVSIDHAKVKNLDQYRVTSPVFTIFLPDDAVLGLGPTGNYGPVVSDGFWLLLKPLSPGSHTIQIRNARSPGGPLDLTWLLTITK
jgi:hypothetical protein